MSGKNNSSESLHLNLNIIKQTNLPLSKSNWIIHFPILSSLLKYHRINQTKLNFKNILMLPLIKQSVRAAVVKAATGSK